MNHFLLLCPIYTSQRKILLDSVFELDAGIENLSNSKLAELLLYGNPLLYSKKVNASILKLTISYLMNTERFDCPLFAEQAKRRGAFLPLMCVNISLYFGCSASFS